MRYFAIDVFTDQLFGGNPAGVCLLDSWPDDQLLQNIASENNLSETAFLVKGPQAYELRWFTPEMEVNLCGHATMASGFVLLNYVETNAAELHFTTVSGPLAVARGEQGMLWMDFPARPGKLRQNYRSLERSLGVEILETYDAPDILVVVASEAVVRGLDPDFGVLMEVKQEAGLTTDDYGVIVTAPADPPADPGAEPVDFVSRFFAPTLGVPEDPVTGRAHCVLTPYWAARLGKPSLKALQVSARGGELWCEDAGDRVRIGGRARLYMQGEIAL